MRGLPGCLEDGVIAVRPKWPCGRYVTGEKCYASFVLIDDEVLHMRDAMSF